MAPVVRYKIPTSNIVFFIFLLKTVHAAGNGGDDEDEFANNLFSDLAPLLALFGERVAQQFLSEATSNWSDSIIFAMAPIGIITAVVGAIRVGAPGWLKSLIGRSRESSALVELDLLSSTSTDVCEMWNGNAIVRIMGSPPILQLISVEGAAGEEDRFHTLDSPDFDKKATKELFKHYKHKDDEESARHSELPSFQGQFSKRVGPNISLNLNLHKNPHWKTLELRLFAIFGFLVQLAVPAYTAVITYHPTKRKLKKGKRVEDYAFPLTVLGTALVNFGMILCATVIGRKTREYTCTWKDRKKLRILWIQRRATVNDQVFDSYAIISPGACSFVMTSWPSHLLLPTLHSSTPSQNEPNQTSVTNHEVRRRNGVAVATGETPPENHSTPQHQSHKSKISADVKGLLHGRYTESLWALFGAFFGIVGFVGQFVGLRAMQADAAIAQLIATGIMVVARAFVRRPPPLRPIAIKLEPDFELDWLAEASYRGANKVFEYYLTSTELEKEKAEIVEIGHCCGYGKDPSGNQIHHFITSELAETEDVQKLLIERVSLRKISLWSSKGARTAAALAKAIEVVMDTLFPLDAGGDYAKYQWPLNVTMDGSSNGTDMQRMYFTVERKGKSKSWIACLPEIEAALSLRLFTIHKRRQAVVHYTDYSNSIQRQEWNPTEQNLTLLCPNTQSTRRDFEWWLLNGTAILETSLRSPLESPDTAPYLEEMGNRKIVSIDIKPERILGYSFQRLKQNTNVYTFGTTRFESDKFHMKFTETRRDRSQWLASISDVSIETAIAQDWFSSFLWSMASSTSCAKLTHTNTRMRPSDIREVADRPQWSIFRLEDPSITTIAESFHELGLGTLKDGYMRVIAPLSYHGKLPNAEAELFRLAREHANKFLQEQDYIQAGRVYLWLFRTCMTFQESESESEKVLPTRGTACLLEYYRFLSTVAEMWMYELQEGDRVSHVRTMLKELHQELKKMADQNILRDLIRLGHIQGRLQVVDKLQRHKWDIPEEGDAEVGKFDKSLGLQPLHIYVLRKDLATIQEIGGRGVDEVDIFGWSPLHYAAANGTAEMVTALLHRAAHTRIADNMGWTPLHYAAKNGNFETLKVLLYGGADPLIAGVDGMTPLHCAAQAGNTAIVLQLLEVGSLVDARDISGKTPLHWACCNGHKIVVSQLLEKLASVDTTDKNGKSCAHFAGMNNVKGVINRLMKAQPYRKQTDRDHSTPVHIGAALGNADVIYCMVGDGKGFPPRMLDKNKATPLHIAAEMGHVKAVHVLRKRAPDCVAYIDKNGYTPLHLAIRSGVEECIDLICEAVLYGNRDLERTTATVLEKAKAELRSRIFNEAGQPHRASLHDAVALNEKEIVQQLINKILLDQKLNRLDQELKSIDQELKNRSTPLHVAVRSGNADMVNFLRSQGAKINALTIQKMTPLAAAVYVGDLQMCQLLMKDSDLKLKTRDGDTLLHLATAHCPAFVDELLKPEIAFDINLQNNMGNTALHTAILLGNEAIMRVLVEHGANMEIANSDVQTPLYLATVRAEAEMVRYLIEAGADVTFKGGALDPPQTALHYAVREKRTDIMEIFLEPNPTGRSALEVPTDPPNSLTPLHVAATSGSVSCVQMLVQAGANIEATTAGLRRTPLHLAARSGKMEVVRWLVNAGADVLAKDRDGDNAMRNAEFGTNGNGKKDNAGIVRFLREAIEARRRSDARAAQRLEVPREVVEEE